MSILRRFIVSLAAAQVLSLVACAAARAPMNDAVDAAGLPPGADGGALEDAAPLDDATAPSSDAQTPDAQPDGDAAPPPLDLPLQAMTTTAATGFPTAWFGFPLPPGDFSLSGLHGDVAVANSADVYSEVLFIVGYLPSGACPSGRWPDTTPEYGPSGIRNVAHFIVKAPTKGMFTAPIDLTLPGGPAIAHCILLGLNGGTVSRAHDVTSTSHLTLRYSAPSGHTLVGLGGEFCFGQTWGCQRATNDANASFATVHPIRTPSRLLALYGNISDSTFDGTTSFGAPPTGAWTAQNEFYVYHGAECAALAANGGIAGPGDYVHHIPIDAIHLASVPLAGHGIGAAQQAVFQELSTPLVPGDCIVNLFGVGAVGGFDNETQVNALIAPQ